MRDVALSQSLPTPNTQELARVLTRLAVGVPELALPEVFAPIAPEPFVPEVSVPVKVITVIEAATLCDRLARTATWERVVGANARQISAVPNCALVRCTNTQVRFAPATLVTVMRADLASAETNASNNSLGEIVENDGEVIFVLELELSPETVTSIPTAPQTWLAPSRHNTNRIRRMTYPQGRVLGLAAATTLNPFGSDDAFIMANRIIVHPQVGLLCAAGRSVGASRHE